MTETATLVSVVVESHEALQEGDVTLASVLDALDAQTIGRERIEVVVATSRPEEWIRQLLASRSHVRVVESEDDAYYRLKTAGAAVATGSIIAFIDSDTRPDLDWLERLVAPLENGADAATGRTRYPEKGLLARCLDYCDWGHVYARADGSATALVSNNLAVRRETWDAHPFDPRLKRTGACYLASQQMRAAGLRLVYVPDARITHSYRHVGSDFFLRRCRSGWDSVVVGRLSSPRVLNEAKAMRLGLLGPFAIFAGRLFADFRHLPAHEELRRWELPFAALFQVAARAIEAGAALVTAIRPRYLADRYDW